MAVSYKAIAEYYDAEYEHLDYLRRDVPFLMEQMGRRPRRVLEIAAGTGRAAIPLAEAGHRVVASDYDPAMLAIGRRKAAFVGLGETRLRFCRGDARTVRLRGEKFDWCVILFNTLLAFPTLEAMDAVLTTCRWHLKKKGRLWVDVFNPDLRLLAESQSYGLDPVTFHVPGLDRTVSRTSDLEDIGGTATQRRRVTFHYRWFEGGEEKYRKKSFEMTWVMPRELQVLLERNGFVLRRMFGDYDGGAVGPSSSRLIALAERM
jgi:ubiquinone/menaquinone biosynthesis C-methylase UbiE